MVHLLGGPVGAKLSFIFHSSVLFGQDLSLECLLHGGAHRENGLSLYMLLSGPVPSALQG